MQSHRAQVAGTAAINKALLHLLSLLCVCVRLRETRLGMAAEPSGCAMTRAWRAVVHALPALAELQRLAPYLLTQSTGGCRTLTEHSSGRSGPSGMLLQHIEQRATETATNKVR